MSPAFPYHLDLPSSLAQRPDMISISLEIPIPLLVPICRVCGRRFTPVSACMLMPKASVNKDDLPTRDQNDVWFASQPFHVEGIPKAHGVDEAPHDDFRRGVYATNSAHAFAPLFRAKIVHQPIIPPGFLRQSPQVPLEPGYLWLWFPGRQPRHP
jgi:hypothetical protein